VRSYKAVGGTPVFAEGGQGARITDLDGHTYTDFVGSYGPLILGHADERVVQAVSEAAQRGTSFGMPTQLENELAEQVVEAIPGIERVRFVNSGTEAGMSAIRIARAATGRDKILKCSGCYHGHSDGLLVQAGSGAATLGTPSSPGVPESIAAHTLLAPYNDLDAVEALLKAHRGEIACFAVEPVAGNMGVVPPEPGYLEGLRRLCDAHGALLLFDEVMTGFRVAYGGAQARYEVRPDLTCLGKIVGGGLPCAAVGGRTDLMGWLAPEGPVYQSGTLSGNPLAMAAGRATLAALRAENPYAALEKRAGALAEGLEDAARVAGAPMHVQRVGSMWCAFFREERVRNFADAAACDTDRYASFFHAMRERGILLPPAQYESCFLSTAHGEAEIEQTLRAAREALKAAA
jgi:glutamate-1-semialdehyde 2,1-aminomutase